MTDKSLRIMLIDLQPHQQCAAIIMRLGGSAREMARMVTPQDMMNGGILNGVAVDAVTYCSDPSTPSSLPLKRRAVSLP